MTLQRGRFVVFEGPDGVGKSTLVKAVAEALDARGNEHVVVTREPTDWHHGQNIRMALRGELQPSEEPTQRELAEWFAADRVEHLYREVMPRLLDGCVVLCDRYLLSSLVYQTTVGGMATADVLSLNRYTVMPDVMFVLRAPWTVCRERIQRRGNGVDAFEREEVQRRVHEGYANWVPTNELARKAYIMNTFTHGMNALVARVIEVICGNT